MKPFAFTILALLALGAPAWGADGAGAVTPTSAVAATATRPAPAFDEHFGHLAVGLGYPDVRLRCTLGHGLDADAKFAFAQGVQVYTARLGWDFADLGPLKVIAAAEGGYASLNNADGVNGYGTAFSGALGLEYPFARSFRLNVDLGPVWAHASSDLASVSTVDVVFNTAIYYYLF